MRVLGVFQILRYALLAVLGLTVAGVVWSAVTFDASKQPWSCCCIELPEDRVKLTFCRRAAHPFLAEYERTIAIEQAGGRRTTSALPDDSGGVDWVDVYWVVPEWGSGPQVLLRDKWREYLVDPSTGDVRLIVRIGSGRVFAGPLMGGNAGASVVTDSSGNVTVTVNGRPAEELTHIGIDTRREHLGRIIEDHGEPVFVAGGVGERE